MKLDRRDFFKTAAGVTAFTLGLNAYAPSVFRRKLLLAAPPPGQKKLLFIFLRGGIDAINTVVPVMDPGYNSTNRPALFLQNTIALDGTDPAYPIGPTPPSWMRLHPSLAPLMNVYAAGNLAFIHRVGYANQSQSHFDSQQYYENGTTNKPNLDVGMFYRQAAEKLDIVNNHFAAVSLSGNQMVALKGPNPIPNISDVKTFKFAGTAARTKKFVGQLPSPGPARGILGVYGRDDAADTNPYSPLVRQTGRVLADAMSIINDPVNPINPDTYVPSNGVVYPSNSSFFYKIKQCAQLLKQTPVQMVCINQGGYDTHSDQGRYTGSHPNLIGQLATAISLLYQDLKSQWNDLIIVTSSEFGRTSSGNGSGGTDHGSSTVVFLAGGAVKGGVYNAATIETWMGAPSGLKTGGIYSSDSGRYLQYRTDFRTVFAEIFSKYYGDDMAMLNRVIPGYQALHGTSSVYNYLNFL